MTDSDDTSTTEDDGMSRDRQRELISWILVGLVGIYVLADPLLAGGWAPNSATVGALISGILTLLLSDKVT